MLACLLLLAATPGLQTSGSARLPVLHLEAAKSEILVGEPLKVTVTWTSAEKLDINPESVEFWIDAGQGLRRHVETSYQSSSVLSAPIALEPSKPLKTSDVLAVSGGGLPGSGDPFRAAFAAPGTVRIKAVYPPAESNVVTITVTQPSGADAELFVNHLGSRPELLTDWTLLNLHGTEDTELLESLARNYPRSPYMDRARLLVWRHQIAEALRREEADPLNGFLGALLEEIRGTPMSGSPFDEDRLFLVATTRLDWRDRLGAAAILRELIERYPNGAAAQVAEDMVAQLGDSTPPTLALTASPSLLWPPNQKLETITVAVSVSDDTDPKPSVKLVSVSCDDGCVPANDIAGTAYGTDDRTFELRSERKGVGSGRTYTVTYEAKDAAGNKATATTTVNVAHDQGTAKK